VDGVTLLHLAALRSETRMIYLIEQGADPEAVIKRGRNILHLAARARQANVVGYLCQVSPSHLHFSYYLNHCVA